MLFFLFTDAADPTISDEHADLSPHRPVTDGKSDLIMSTMAEIKPKDLKKSYLLPPIFHIRCFLSINHDQKNEVSDPIFSLYF